MKIANGMELEDGEIHTDAISYASEGDKSQVGIEIHSVVIVSFVVSSNLSIYHVVKNRPCLFLPVWQRRISAVENGATWTKERLTLFVWVLE